MELEIKCTECSGIGTYLQEVQLYSANGKKKLKKKMMSFACNKCGGSGQQPSEFGLAILAFIEKYQDFDTKVSDIVDRQLDYIDSKKYSQY